MARMADGPPLSRAERLSLAVTRFVNERPRAKHAQHLFLSRFNQSWVRHAIGRRIYVDNIEWLLEQPSERGVLLCMNHRSYFDAYITMFAIYELGGHWANKIYFPVRSNFFYEHPVGFAVNLLIGGGTLYPPIFRDTAKSELNRDALERMVRFLDRPGALIGMHPEGTRGKGPDPYQLLPAQPGVGQVVLQGRPTVVPAFVNGLSNSYMNDIADNYRRDIRHERPIIIAFGGPLDYSDLAAQKPRAALYKRTADRIRDAIIQLGAREREIRAACLSGAIGNDDPHWVMNHALGPRP
jgi:1-acyl-sn-glycerol-3-phosphate acyltransferase